MSGGLTVTLDVLKCNELTVISRILFKINGNIRCFEITWSSAPGESVKGINGNIRCFEIWV